MRRLLLPFVVLMALLWAWFFFRPEAPVSPTAAPVNRPAVAAAPPRVLLDKPATPPSRRRPAPVNAAPAAAPPPEAPRPIDAAASPEEGAAEAENAGPIDRRRPDQQDGGGLQASIKQMMDYASEDIERCISDWAAVDPNLAGEVVIGFQFDKDGLTSAWVTDHSDVPAGPRSCFAAAVYDIDWSGLTDEPVEVTWPFSFSATGAP